MKRYLLITGLLIVTAAFAAPRRVLFEEFTRVSG
jgi:hypothetical protein